MQGSIYISFQNFLLQIRMKNNRFPTYTIKYLLIGGGVSFFIGECMVALALLLFISSSKWGVGGKFGALNSEFIQMFISLQFAVILLSFLFGYSFQKLKTRKTPPFSWENSFSLLTWNLFLTLIILTITQIIPSSIETYQYILSFNNKFLDTDATQVTSLLLSLIGGYYVIGLPVSHFLLNYHNSKIGSE